MAGVNRRRTQTVALFVAVTALVFVWFHWRISPITKLAALVDLGRFKATAGDKEDLGISGDHTEETDCTTFMRLVGPMANAQLLPTNATAISGGQGKGSLTDTGQLDGAQAFQLLNSLFVKGQLDFRRVASYPVAEEWLTPMDLEVLADEPLNDLTTVAQAGNSTVLLAPWPPDGRVKVGDKVTARVDLKDGRGRPVRKGGHLVRIWMTQTAGRTQRSIAADVTDLRNGSYLASLPVLWSGRYEVMAALMRSREVHRVVLGLTRAMKLTTQIVGFFVSGQTDQATLCSFIPAVPGFLEVCNLTEANDGLPWYCGKPTKAGLRCDHWAQSLSTQRATTTHAPLDDLLLFQPQFSSGFHLLTTSSSFSGTRGYWENNAWQPLIGCPLPPLVPARASTCLRDTRIIFYGDSNTRYWMTYVASTLGCKETPQNENFLTHEVHCGESNITLATHPHAYPYLCNTPKRGCHAVHEKRALQAVLDKVPGTGNVVVILHLYLHFGPMHSYIHALHARHAAQAVRQMLARNPRAKVFVRGPHAVCWDYFLEMSDYHARRSLAILRHEFRDLTDRVVLLNTWDMTVASRNCDIHPPQPVLQILSRMVLAHVCPAS